MSFQSIPARVQEHGRKTPDAPCYHTKVGDQWKAHSWKQYAEEVSLAGRALIALGFQPGQVVCMLGFNRPEWVMFQMGAMSAGGAAAGIYTTCSASEVQYILSHSEAFAVLLEDESQWEKVQKHRADLPNLKVVVMMRGARVPNVEDVMGWDQLIAKGKEATEEALNARLAAIEPDQLATLIYTSGTTGPPKGVMLSHNNLVWTAQIAMEITTIDNSDCTLSYLPLSHIAEQMFSVHSPAVNGFQVYYAESLAKVPDNLKEVQPTVFFGVPRIWEKFHTGIYNKTQQATGLKKFLLGWAQSVGTRVNHMRGYGQEPTGFLALQYSLATKVIFSKLKPVVGMGRIRIPVSGAAPISREVLEFFASLDIQIYEVYGQSEDTGPTSFNLPGATRLGTVGRPIKGVEVKIAEDGEILVRGPNVFLGYYKEPAATAETLIDGWLHSGDLGKLDDEGFLHITGRKKEIIITAGGKNITPKNIEEGLKNHPLINEAVVIGDRRKYLVALVTLDPEAAPKWAADNGVAVESLPTNPKLLATLNEHVQVVNHDLSRVEQLKKILVLPRNLTQEDGELTPTLKVKRRKVNENWSAQIESLYAEGGDD